jgi:hypothetical protein
MISWTMVMETFDKQLVPIISVISGLLISQSVLARDYVPPPSGPYQSSIVVNNSQDGDSQQKVYKFPPPDILLDDSGSRADFLQPPDPVGEVSGQAAPPVMQAPLAAQPQLVPPNAPLQTGQGQFYQPQTVPSWSPDTRSGWYGYQGNVPNYNQNVWQQSPAYGYPQQYPYQYRGGNQYNGANNPFNGMPSPWNVMRSNPFFTDN